MFPIHLTTGAVPSPPQDHKALLHEAPLRRAPSSF